MADPTPTEPQPQPERPPSTAPATGVPPARLGAGRIAMIVGGVLMALVALAVLAVGAFGLWLYTSERSGGFVMTSSERFATPGHALATRTLHVSSDVPGFLYGRHWLGDVRIRGQSANPARPLFIGIAPRADVDRYLAGVAHTEVLDVSADPVGTSYRPTYRSRPGLRRPAAPGGEPFWVAEAAGAGREEVTWSVRPGRWAVVVMRPDGSRGVSADLAAGAKLPALLWVSIVVLAIGLLVLAGAAALIFFGARTRRRTPPPPTTSGPGGVHAEWV